MRHARPRDRHRHGDVALLLVHLAPLRDLDLGDLGDRALHDPARPAVRSRQRSVALARLRRLGHGLGHLGVRRAASLPTSRDGQEDPQEELLLHLRLHGRALVARAHGCVGPHPASSQFLPFVGLHYREAKASSCRVDFDRFIKAVGENVRKARWRAQLTQEEASADVLTFRLLGELERGDGNPSLRTLFLLAERLGVSVRDLVEVGDEPPLEVQLRDLQVDPPKRGRKPKRRPTSRD
ncbi:XRE family transcriptional regulator [Polyangium fumosum]|uniref:XRE family transcriptional regulator n=1 Tax=Polyangium fumosum TaxID=889272 RepID=A0A4U1JJ02_9BACT|nr:XRE family transcriptional regulator [Polyangium fumosum]